MRITIRVGDSLTDLSTVHRVSVETIGTRNFLVGVRQSGRVVAIYALRPNVSPHRVSECLEAVIGSGRHVCAMTQELIAINNDPDALAQIERHNADIEFRAGIEVPNTPERTLVDVS